MAVTALIELIPGDLTQIMWWRPSGYSNCSFHEMTQLASVGDCVWGHGSSRGDFFFSHKVLINEDRSVEGFFVCTCTVIVLILGSLEKLVLIIQELNWHTKHFSK